MASIKIRKDKDLSNAGTSLDLTSGGLLCMDTIFEIGPRCVLNPFLDFLFLLLYSENYLGRLATIMMAGKFTRHAKYSLEKEEYFTCQAKELQTINLGYIWIQRKEEFHKKWRQLKLDGPKLTLFTL